MSGKSIKNVLKCACAIGALLFVGCERSTKPQPVTETRSLDELEPIVRQTIEEVYRDRVLDTEANGAWQIMHGVLAYGQDLRIKNLQDGNSVSVPAVDHILSGGNVSGWTMRRGANLDKGRLGLVSVIEGGSGLGQGHKDQWLAVLAQCGVDSKQKITVRGRDYLISDWIEQVKLDVHDGQELSWTVIALVNYLGPDARWIAGDDSEWSIERIIGHESEQDIYQSTCGGTHRLIGLAMALESFQKSRAERKTVEPLRPAWENATARIQEAISAARGFQQPDGSFSNTYFLGSEQSIDDKDRLRNTGHIVEFLALALPEDELREPWVRRSINHLCEVLADYRGQPIECGALYHAMHGLVLYHNRCWPDQKLRLSPPEKKSAE